MSGLTGMSARPDQAGEDAGSRTVMWCVPRAVSSAFAKCMCSVPDNEVWFEPYVPCFYTKVEYKRITGSELPMDDVGNEAVFEVGKKMLDFLSGADTYADRLSYASVKRRLEATKAKHVFVKDMGFSLMGLPTDCTGYIPQGYRHTFLIRNPPQALLSYRNAMFKHMLKLGLLEGKAADPYTFDIERDDQYMPPGCFTKELYDLWRYVIDNDIDRHPVIIDCDDLLARPAEVLPAYCRAVGIPYSADLLQWDSSTDVMKTMRAVGNNFFEGLITFHRTAMSSDRFMPASQPPTRDELPADVIRCADKVSKYFHEMYEHRLKV